MREVRENRTIRQRTSVAAAATTKSIALFLIFELAACSLVIDPPPVQPPLRNVDTIAPLTWSEKARFLYENLGELAPGIGYRSGDPSDDLLEFLVKRVNLGQILDIQRKPDPREKEFIESHGGTYTHVRMGASHPPTPRKVLEMIRVTLRAQEEGRPFLMHCRAGADRTGMMGAIWRMLFQGVSDRELLKRHTSYHFHIPPAYPNVYRILDLFPVELYRPFIDNPQLLDDEKRIAELEAHVFREYPLLSGRTSVREGPLSAGVAKTLLLEGWAEDVQMATYGPSPGKATGVREPVYARAVVLEQNELRVAIVSCDLLTTDLSMRQRVAQRLEEEGVELHDLLLSATHTHTSVGAYVDDWIYEFYMFGPYDERFRTHLVERAVEAIKSAASNAEPARLGVGKTSVEQLNHNRRLGKTVDNEVGVIKLTRGDGSPLAVLVNFAGHPILEPDDGYISPDYPGYLSRKLDEEFNFGMFLGGALGDLNANPPDAEGAWRTQGLAQEVAEHLYTAVKPVAAKLKTQSDIKLGSMTTYYELPPLNLNLIPDLFFVVEWPLRGLIDWPVYVPLQVIRLGDVALVATATEMSVRLGLDLKRRSPVEHTFVVTHANAYAGYAVTQPNHAKSKVDPTSFVALNGPTHGPKAINDALLMIDAFWGREPQKEPLEKPLPGAHTATVDNGPYDSPVSPQNRRFDHAVLDTVPDRFRLESSFLYLDEQRGGNGAVAHTSRTSVRGTVRLPWELLFDVKGGYTKSNWKVDGVRNDDEGTTDLAFGLQRAFHLAEDETEGNSLRGIPRISTTAPTADAKSTAPLAFAAGAGVWRPSFGGALEFVWNTYRTLSVETMYITSIDRYRRRRAGDRWETLTAYTERHGFASLFLELHTAVQLKDHRNGGRTSVDVDETSFEMSLRPGISFHVADAAELFARGPLSVARSGNGAGSGNGGMLGLSVGF